MRRQGRRLKHCLFLPDRFARALSLSSDAAAHSSAMAAGSASYHPDGSLPLYEAGITGCNGTSLGAAARRPVR